MYNSKRASIQINSKTEIIIIVKPNKAQVKAMAFTVSTSDWRYLKKKLDDVLEKMLIVSIESDEVVISLRAGYDFDALVNAYGGIIQDSMIDEEFASDDTTRLEEIWDNHFVKKA